MIEPVLNLHNHTPFSDGAYTIDELCEAHLELGTRVDGIGISDNLFCTPTSREAKTERDFERLFGNEKRSYVDMVRAARQKWSGKLQVFCGCEINWPLNKNMLPTIVKMLDGIDYVIFDFVDWAGLTTLANQARRFRCPIGLAHGEIGAQFPNTSMDQVIRTLSNARMFYEINAKYLPLSPRDPWFRMFPNHKLRVALGTDTHDDLDTLRDIPKLVEYVEALNVGSKLLALEHSEAHTVSSSS